MEMILWRKARLITGEVENSNIAFAGNRLEKASPERVLLMIDVSMKEAMQCKVHQRQDIYW